MQPTVEIREATAADWVGIWPILRDIIAAGETYCWPVDSSELQARNWWTAKPGGRVFVACTSAGNIIGTAELHPNQPAAGSHVANAGFMVSPNATGQGVGRLLAEYVMTDATASGYRALQFNAVVESNTGAVRLWESLGFTVLATVPGAFHHPIHGYVGLHLMYRKLQEN